MSRKIFLFGFLVVLFTQISALGQGEADWIRKAKEAIKSNEATLKITDGLLKEDSSIYSESFRVSKGSLTGVVEISAYRILENPEETFGGLITVADNTWGKKQTKAKIAGLGDEGYMWSGANADDFTTIQFRKGKTFVSMFIPGRATAQRVAKLVAANMP